MTGREPMKKRSIYGIYEHFEEALNAVSEGYIYFKMACTWKILEPERVK